MARPCQSFSVLVVQFLVAAVDRVRSPSGFEQFWLALAAVSPGIRVPKLVDSRSASQGCRKRFWMACGGFCASHWWGLAVLSHFAAECQRLMLGAASESAEDLLNEMDVSC